MVGTGRWPAALSASIIPLATGATRREEGAVTAMARAYLATPPGLACSYAHVMQVCTCLSSRVRSQVSITVRLGPGPDLTGAGAKV